MLPTSTKVAPSGHRFTPHAGMRSERDRKVTAPVTSGAPGATPQLVGEVGAKVCIQERAARYVLRRAPRRCTEPVGSGACPFRPRLHRSYISVGGAGTLVRGRRLRLTPHGAADGRTGRAVPMDVAHRACRPRCGPLTGPTSPPGEFSLLGGTVWVTSEPRCGHPPRMSSPGCAAPCEGVTRRSGLRATPRRFRREHPKPVVRGTPTNRAVGVSRVHRTHTYRRCSLVGGGFAM